MIASEKSHQNLSDKIYFYSINIGCYLADIILWRVFFKFIVLADIIFGVFFCLMFFFGGDSGSFIPGQLNTIL